MSKLTKLGARRLLRLAKILDTADALHVERKEPAYSQNALEHNCGAPACAWGHYVFSIGLRRRAQFTEPCDFDSRKIRTIRGIDDAEDEFGINYQEREELFGALGCDGAKSATDAATYIRSFVARKGVA